MKWFAITIGLLLALASVNADAGPLKRWFRPKPVTPSPVVPAPVVPLPVVPQRDILFNPTSLKFPAFTNGEVNWKAAYCMVKLSEQIYSDDNVFKQFVESHGLQYRPIQDNTMKCAVVWNDDAVIIVFRGTDITELDDYIVDVCVCFFPLVKGWIHSGFYSAYLTSEKKILDAMPNDNLERQIWITGHSLGGAMAVVCDYFLADKGVEASLLTFGQPMLCNKTLAESLRPAARERYLRFVNESDTVTTLPQYFYHHFGKLVQLSGKTVDIQAVRPGEQLNATEPEITDAEFTDGMAPLTDEELAQLKREIIESRATVSEVNGVTLPPGKVKAMGGPLKNLFDHQVDRYVGKIRAQLDR